MWSSCPWVSATASTRSMFCRTYSKSGSTRSIPGISAWGNDRPASRMRRRSSSSMQAMLRPTSPTPPRNATRAGRRPCALEEPGIHQRLLDPRPLLLGRRDEWQPGRAGGKAQDPEGGLHRDGVGGDEQRVEERRELLVDLSGRRDVAPGHEVRHLTD